MRLEISNPGSSHFEETSLKVDGGNILEASITSAVALTGWQGGQWHPCCSSSGKHVYQQTE